VTLFEKLVGLSSYSKSIFLATKSTPSWVHPQNSFLIWINSEYLSRTTEIL